MDGAHACTQRNQCLAPLQCDRTNAREHDPKSSPAPSSASTPMPESTDNSHASHGPPPSTIPPAERSEPNSVATGHPGKTYAADLLHPYPNQPSRTLQKRTTASAFWDPDCEDLRPRATCTLATHPWHHSSTLPPPTNSESVTRGHLHTTATRSLSHENRPL